MSEIDVSKAIQPRSDQQNADSLLSGPRTIRIRDIAFNPEAELQPLWIYFDGDENKPWKPCRTATRCLVSIWGKDAKKWIGLSCTIYCDADVTFSGVKTGGIRVSHMEGLDAPRTLMLTKTRGKKGATVIKPLVVEKAKQPEKPAAQPEPNAPTIDKDALFSDARENAALGRKDFGKWFKTKTKPEQDALKEIGAEVTEILDAAEAPPAN